MKQDVLLRTQPSEESERLKTMSHQAINRSSASCQALTASYGSNGKIEPKRQEAIAPLLGAPLSILDLLLWRKESIQERRANPSHNQISPGIRDAGAGNRAYCQKETRQSTVDTTSVT